MPAEDCDNVYPLATTSESSAPAAVDGPYAVPIPTDADGPYAVPTPTDGDKPYAVPADIRAPANGKFKTMWRPDTRQKNAKEHSPYASIEQPDEVKDRDRGPYASIELPDEKKDKDRSPYASMERSDGGNAAARPGVNDSPYATLSRPSSGETRGGGASEAENLYVQCLLQ